MKLSDYLKKYMEEHDISGRELARRCGLSPQTIFNVINQERMIDTNTYAKIANGTGNEISRLMALNGVPYVRVPGEDDAEDMAEYLETFRTRPEMRMLFETSKGMTKEQINAVVAMLEGFKNNS